MGRVEDEEPLDAEIIEIFLEEAGEVLEAIGAQLPAWREAPGPGVPLTELRRAFHTLKGSGRMVGAQVLGELAWSVENLLNRVIERTLPANRETVEAVERAWRLMPSLVEAFASRGAGDRAAGDQLPQACLLYTPDAAEERSRVELGGRRVIKKKKREER